MDYGRLTSLAAMVVSRRLRCELCVQTGHDPRCELSCECGAKLKSERNLIEFHP